MERRPYRVFVERKTVNAPPWRVEWPGGHADAHEVVIQGTARTRIDPDQPKQHGVTGTGVITVLGDRRIVITESEA